MPDVFAADPLPGRAAVRLATLLREDAGAIRLCVPVAGSLPRTACWLVPAVLSMAPGASLEVLMGPDEAEVDAVLGVLGDATAQLAGVRVLSSTVPLLMVVDGAEVVIPETGPGPTTSEPVRLLVDALWAAARPVAEGRPIGLSAQTLELLAAGLTDRVAASHLGVSERTYRRVVAQLMDSLGARSRFEAGIRAAAWGWIGHPSDTG